MAEVLDLVDGDGKPLNRTILRGGGIPEGCYVIVVNIMTVNSSGKILMTRRAKNKTMPGCWEITGGAKVAGETPIAAAVRELSEETGIHVRENELIFCGSERNPHWFNYYYLCYKDVPFSQIRLQAGETDAAKWVTAANCLALVREDTRRTPESIKSHYPQIFCKSTAKEKYDVYDPEKRKTGTVLGRDVKPPPGTYKLLVTVMTVNGSGEILLTKRADGKKNAGLWELTTGHAQAGETGREAAVRELCEETGIRTEKAALDYRGDIKVQHCIFSLYLLKKDVPKNEIQLRKGETADAKWVTPSELLQMHRDGVLILYGDAEMLRLYADMLPDQEKN